MLQLNSFIHAHNLRLSWIINIARVIFVALFLMGSFPGNEIHKSFLGFGIAKICGSMPYRVGLLKFIKTFLGFGIRTISGSLPSRDGLQPATADQTWPQEWQKWPQFQKVFIFQAQSTGKDYLYKQDLAKGKIRPSQRQKVKLKAWG